MKPLLFLAIIILFTATSCRKVCDFIRDHPDAHDSLCRVTKFYVTNILGTPDTFYLTYNTKGDPVSMLSTSHQDAPGNLDQYYRYDRFGRLSDNMLTFIKEFGAVFWHKYAYPRKDYILDTLLVYQGDDVRGPSPNAAAIGGYGLKAYSLDAHDRIVKIWSLNDPHHPQLMEEIKYDANGNKIQSDSALKYDDKVNPYRTNKVWQFLYNDYSRNNLILNDPFVYVNNIYNEFGLPTQLVNLENHNPNILLFGSTNIAPYIHITYACSAPKGPINY